jgi:hypothetical protein
MLRAAYAGCQTRRTSGCPRLRRFAGPSGHRGSGAARPARHPHQSRLLRHGVVRRANAPARVGSPPGGDLQRRAHSREPLQHRPVHDSDVSADAPGRLHGPDPLGRRGVARYSVHHHLCARRAVPARRRRGQDHGAGLLGSRRGRRLRVRPRSGVRRERPDLQRYHRPADEPDRAQRLPGHLHGADQGSKRLRRGSLGRTRSR